MKLETYRRRLATRMSVTEQPGGGAIVPCGSLIRSFRARFTTPLRFRCRRVLLLKKTRLGACALRAELRLPGAIITSDGDTRDGGRRGARRDRHNRRTPAEPRGDSEGRSRPAHIRRCSTWWCSRPTDRDRIRRHSRPAHNHRQSRPARSLHSSLDHNRSRSPARKRMPPITAPAINPPAQPPPRQRASAGLGAATALTPSTAAVARTSAVFFTLSAPRFGFRPSHNETAFGKVAALNQRTRMTMNERLSR